jgi:hypothetical protein
LDITTGSLNAGYLSSIKSGEEYKYISDFTAKFLRMGHM